MTYHDEPYQFLPLPRINIKTLFLSPVTIRKRNVRYWATAKRCRVSEEKLTTL